MIAFPISEILKLHDESALYAILGVAAFVASTMGTMLMKCLITRRRQRVKEEKFKDEVKQIVEKTAKDVMLEIELKEPPTKESVNSGKVLDV